jgi:osomolarity two-component system, sensor histidine kinase SLN1
LSLIKKGSTLIEHYRYVFHEVRVPLNTALLAVQNMAAVGVFGRAHELEFNALEGSLNMMSKVLNDVLDFNRMDSGRFESVSKPYAFHNAFDAIFMPLRLATDSRGLHLVTDLDAEIDRVAKRAVYQSMGNSPDEIARKLQEHPEEPGMVVGDEMRLRQVSVPSFSARRVAELLNGVT